MLDSVKEGSGSTTRALASPQRQDSKASGSAQLAGNTNEALIHQIKGYMQRCFLTLC